MFMSQTQMAREHQRIKSIVLQRERRQRTICVGPCKSCYGIQAEISPYFKDISTFASFGPNGAIKSVSLNISIL